MDAFESLISMLFRHEGYWTTANFKVELTPEDKKAINRPSSPRWELDLLAYKADENELFMIECKSYLDSTGVLFRNGNFEYPERYKLFTDPKLLEIVQDRLVNQLLTKGMCRPSPKLTLCLAVGKMANQTDVQEMQENFHSRSWQLIQPEWITDQLEKAATLGYENDMAFVVSKLLLKKKGKGSAP